MQTTLLSPGLIRYSFPPGPIKRVDHHIYVLHNQRLGLLIDPAYPDMVGEILADLAQRGITLTDTFVSHFHDDHYFGLPAIAQLPVWAAKSGDPAIQRNVITPGDTLQFHGHTLVCHPGGGHADCGLIIVIDQAWVHANDLVITSLDGGHLLPLILHDVIAYIESLHLIQKLQLPLLLTHGHFNTDADYHRDLELRLAYCHALLAQGPEMDLEAFEKQHKISFDYGAMHNFNTARLQLAQQG